MTATTAATSARQARALEVAQQLTAILEDCFDDGTPVIDAALTSTPQLRERFAAAVGIADPQPRRSESCQVADVSMSDDLCEVSESGGYRCENPDRDHTSHWISDHTIAHALAGNMYACSAIEPGPQL